MRRLIVAAMTCALLVPASAALARGDGWKYLGAPHPHEPAVESAVDRPVIGTCAGETATIVGTAGDDVLYGTSRHDVIDAGGGNDLVLGLGGNDIICGDAGHDHIYGGQGSDTVYGGTSSDYLVGGAGGDTLWGYAYQDAGETAADTFWDGTGFDRVYGGLGSNDILYVCLDNQPSDPLKAGVETTLGPSSMYCSNP